MADHNFTPGGRTHTILARLAQGSCMPGYLLRALGIETPAPRYRLKKFWRLMDVLRSEGLVFQGADKFVEILPPGQALLDRLNLQAAPPATGSPTVRIFARKEAA